VENYILNVKREHPSWCARKIRERLIRRFSGIPIPAKSTIHAVLDRYGLVERRGRVRRRAQGTALFLRPASFFAPIINWIGFVIVDAARCSLVTYVLSSICKRRPPLLSKGLG